MVGRGGMGEVYRAKQLSMEREVALKVLAPRLAKQDPAFAELFVAEARAAGKLNHPNIVAVHDVGKAEAPADCGLPAGEVVHYFSMEFIDGETVKDVIERQGAVDLATVGKVMAAMAEALGFAEAHKVVHRDIKPDNIMLTSAGLVKLADLGLALQADSAEAIAGSKDEQGRGKVMGTPLYMAPEQARAHPIDHRADQYALGATLFHMLTGRTPYQGENARAIMRAHCFDPVPDPCEVNPQVPPPWRDLCLRMLAKSPDERLPGAAELRAAVKAATRWKPGVSMRARETRGRANTPWGALLLAAGVALALFWWFVLRAPNAPPAPPKSVPPTSQMPNLAAAARARATQELAALPNDPSAALAVVEQLLAEPALSDARDLLQERRDNLRAAIEERRRNSLRAAADAIQAALKAGQIGEAREALARLPDEPWLADRRQGLSRDLVVAERAGEARLNGQIDAAADAETCDRLRLDIVRSGLDGDRRQALSERLERRRRELAARAAPKMQKPDSAALWHALGEQCEPVRANLPYSTLIEVLRSGARPFADEERVQVENLARLVDLAQQAEAALRLYIAQATPRADCRFGNRSGTYLLTRLEKDWIGFRLPDVPAETKAERATAVVPWSQILARALSGADAARQTAAYLWYWRQPEANAALAALKDDPLAIAVATYERRTRPLDLAGEIERRGGGLLAASYPFATTRKADYLEAWAGSAELVDRGLHWSSTALVEAGSMSEKDLPSLRWKGSLRPPLVLEATVQPDAGSEIIMIGLTSGDLVLRVGLNHKRQGFILATKADDSSSYEALSSGSPPDFNPNDWSHLRLTVDADGKLSATLNDKPVTSPRELAFPRDARLAPILQGRAIRKGAGMVVESLTIVGKP